MQITRNEHQRYMVRLAPVLILLYLIQVYFYNRFVPGESQGMSLFLGLGLALIMYLYHFYDQHHKITLKNNYIETRFDLLKRKEEILYRNVTHIEVKKSRFYFGNITLHTIDGEIHRLHHLDSPDLVAQFIEKKKSGKG